MLLRHSKIDGLTVLRPLRKARKDATDKVKGLDLGADDCLAKPFSGDELVALSALETLAGKFKIDLLKTKALK